MLMSIETHITCDFQGWGSGPPISPLDPHMNTHSPQPLPLGMNTGQTGIMLIEFFF